MLGTNFYYQPRMREGNIFIAYRMGGLCGTAHEISGIMAPLFLHGWGGGVGWDGGGGWGVGGG